MIRPDPNNPRAMELAAYLEQHLDLDRLPADLCLVLGGDGIMLRVIHELGRKLTYLGLNCGHIGFLLNDVADPAKVVTQLEVGAWRTFSFPRLRMVASSSRPEGQAVDGNGSCTQKALAINDVYVERMETYSCNLRLAIDGITVVERLMCDGLVIATSLGSTGYSFSAGGPACHPLLRSLHITPICPRSPRLVPLVVPMNARVEVWPLDADRRPARAVADWMGFPNIDHLLVQDGRSDIKLAFLEGHDFTGTMFRKVLLH